MNLIERIENNMLNSISTVQNTLLATQNPIALAEQLMTHCLLSGKKVLSCGNGGAASQAQHFSSLMLNRYEKERPSLPAIALTSDTSTLTAIANDYNYDTIFSKQIQALGQSEDILFTITSSGNSANVINAIDAAHERGLHIIALTGRNGGETATRLRHDDVEIRIPSDSTPRIQESQLLVIHCLCDLIDHQLTGQ